MQASLFANLTSLALSPSLNGGAFTWPRLVPGTDLTLALRWVENLEGRNTEVTRTLTALKVSLGKADARPTSGSFKLHLGHQPAEPGVNVTAAIAFNASALELQTAINALSAFDDCTVTDEAGTFRIRLGDGSEEVEAAVIENTLRPVAFVEWQVVSHNSELIHELRLTQTPVAQTVDWALVAAEAPQIERLQAGGDNEDVEWNEIQKLTILPTFRGSFQLRRGYRKSPPIGLPTSAEAIAEALEPLADLDSVFLTTEIQDGVLIEFSGEMGGRSHDLLTVEVIDQAPGDPTFTLRTDTAELWSLLSQLDPRGELRLPLEIKAWLQDPEGDEPNKRVVFKQEVVITAPVDVAARNVSSMITWNQPRGRRAVLPFTPGQVLVGNRSYASTIGDGVATSFVLNHNLAEPTVQVTIRENSTGGRLIIHGLEYETSIGGDNSLTITPQPATLAGGRLTNDQWTVLVVSAGQAVYQAHEHAIGEVIGLRTELDALGAAVTALEALAPTGALSSRDVAPGTPVAQWLLPAVMEAYPARVGLSLGAEETLMDIPAALLPRDGGLVGAIHDASATDITTLPADPTMNSLYRYTGTADLPLAGGLGRRSVVLKTNDHLVHDGRVWYRVVRQDGGKTSWYPEDFDRELFVLAVSSKQLIAKRVAELQIGFEVALRSNRERDAARYTGDLRNTQAQWVLVIEHGAFTAETAPSTPDVNLKAIDWNPTPILSHRLIVTRNAGTHSFGVRINRNATGVLSSDAIYYGASEAGGSVPASADFALRARLIQFDILDGLADPRGLLLLRGLDVSLNEEDDTMGRMILR